MPPFNAKPKPNKKQEIDASPDSADGARNITETKVWQSSRRSAQRFWYNYRNLLQNSFNNMSREEQEALIARFCTIITLGVTVLLILAFSNFLPREVRVLGVPVALFVGWFLGTRVVTDVMLERLDGILKKE